MNKYLTAGIAALAAATLAPAVAHADTQATVTATCDAVTITAPSEGFLIFGVDAEPPMTVPAGTTLSYPFFQHSSTHYWSSGVIAGLVQYDYQTGQVDGCQVLPFPAPLVDSIGELGAPVPAADVVPADPATDPTIQPTTLISEGLVDGDPATNVQDSTVQVPDPSANPSNTAHKVQDSAELYIATGM